MSSKNKGYRNLKYLLDKYDWELLDDYKGQREKHNFRNTRTDEIVRVTGNCIIVCLKKTGFEYPKRISNVEKVNNINKGKIKKGYDNLMNHLDKYGWSLLSENYEKQSSHYRFKHKQTGTIVHCTGTEMITNLKRNGFKYKVQYL